MTVKEIADDVAALCGAGRSEEASRKHHANDIVSIEAMAPPGMDPVSRGKAAVQAKDEWWTTNHEVSGIEVLGPFINGDQFTLHFAMDIKVKATGQTMQMKEVALYTVKDGKIVEERFFFGG